MDESVCAKFQSDRDQDDWIGCDCGRWFNKGCTGEESEKILGMNEEELSEYKFVCNICI